MCGVFGVVSNTNDQVQIQKMKTAFVLLGIYNDSRGSHSWGMWSRYFESWRGLGYFKNSPERAGTYMRAWGGEVGDYICGHTRFGTHGEKSVDNAHPFDVRHITLAHNGVVNVDSDNNEVLMHPVDSGQLATLISLVGVKKAVAETSGSMTLVWSDNQHNKDLFLYRHNQVLSIAMGPWGWAFSSCKDHLEHALAFAGLPVHSIMTPEEDQVICPWNEAWVPDYCPAAPDHYNFRSDWKSFGTTSSLPLLRKTEYAYNPLGSYISGEDEELDFGYEEEQASFDEQLIDCTVVYCVREEVIGIQDANEIITFVDVSDAHFYDYFDHVEHEFEDKAEAEAFFREGMCALCEARPATHLAKEGKAIYNVCKSCCEEMAGV